MKSKFQETKELIHSLSRSIAIDLIRESDLTARERDILINHELERTVSIKELAVKYSVEERTILKAKQKAFSRLCYWLHNGEVV